MIFFKFKNSKNSSDDICLSLYKVLSFVHLVTEKTIGGKKKRSWTMNRWDNQKNVIKIKESLEQR